MAKNQNNHYISLKLILGYIEYKYNYLLYIPIQKPFIFELPKTI